MPCKVLYRHAPVMYNNEPVLRNNLWCFTQDYTGKYMQNTQCPSFRLPFNDDTESEFEAVFDFNDVEKRVYTESVNMLDKNDYWVEGTDVATTDQLTLHTFVWVRKSAKNMPQESLLHTYKQYKHYKSSFTAAEKRWNQVKELYKDKVPNGLTAEEWVESYLTPEPR